MQQNGFWQGSVKRTVKIAQVLQSKKELPPLISVSSHDRLIKAVELFQEHNISQLPVIDDGRVVGGLNEASIMKSLHDGVDLNNQQIGPVMGKALPVLDQETDTAEAYRLLLGGSPAIIVPVNDKPFGLITRFDLINILIHQEQNGI
jgi:cystathionine beta-synthase